VAPVQVGCRPVEGQFSARDRPFCFPEALLIAVPLLHIAAAASPRCPRSSPQASRFDILAFLGYDCRKCFHVKTFMHEMLDLKRFAGKGE
jgi:hypothetical protein